MTDNNHTILISDNIQSLKTDIQPSNMTRSVKSTYRSRFFSIEFMLYYAWMLYVYYYGTLYVINQSNYYISTGARNGVEMGWINNRYVDIKDSQYHFFRQQLPFLTLVLILYLSCTKLIQYTSSNNIMIRMIWQLLFNTVFMFYLNGYFIIFMYTISLINYSFTRLCAYKQYSILCPICTWVFNIIILLLNEQYRGYRFMFDSAPELYFGVTGTSWYVLYNLTVLRMISYNMDYYWATQHKKYYDVSGNEVTYDVHKLKCDICIQPKHQCLYMREKQHLQSSEYNILAYYSYLYYVPLYFAGPILSYNSYYSQCKISQNNCSNKQILIYTMRLLSNILLLELMLHYMYVFVLSASTDSIHRDSYTNAMTFYWLLKTIWMKFMIIWKYFYLISLIDGIETYENMRKCMSNHYSVINFWKYWHCSFNQFLLRYIYIPFGGAVYSNNKSQSHIYVILRRTFNVFVVFTFVAFWHDRELKLLIWGWGLVALFLPEFIIRALFNSNLSIIQYIKSNTTLYRCMKSIGGSLMIFCMMIANLIGYSIGPNGVYKTLVDFFTNGGIVLSCIAFTTFYCATQIMIAIEEKKDYDVQQQILKRHLIQSNNNDDTAKLLST